MQIMDTNCDDSVELFIDNIYYCIKETVVNTLRSAQPYLYICFINFGLPSFLFLIVSYMSYITLMKIRDTTLKRNYFHLNAKSVLIVIAHPDDECMFFGPVIISLIRMQRTVYVLCLSNGNAENKGHLRKQELYNSCKVLGVPAENIMLMCSALRQDGQQHKWNARNVAALIVDQVESLSIDTVVTFDKEGVSGHQNHISLYRAVCCLNMCRQLPSNCRTFVLDSIGLIRNYSSFVDCSLSFIVSDTILILNRHEEEIVRQAMREHKTQYLWYRQLHMCFSRYIYVNTFTELSPVND